MRLSFQLFYLIYAVRMCLLGLELFVHFPSFGPFMIDIMPHKSYVTFEPVIVCPSWNFRLYVIIKRYVSSIRNFAVSRFHTEFFLENFSYDSILCGLFVWFLIQLIIVFCGFNDVNAQFFLVILEFNLPDISIKSGEVTNTFYDKDYDIGRW